MHPSSLFCYTIGYKHDIVLFEMHSHKINIREISPIANIIMQSLLNGDHRKEQLSIII